LIPLISGSPLAPAGKSYSTLGEFSYTESFSPDAIDETKISDRLKEMALEKWPNTIDAIVNESQTVVRREVA
jgi:hypothetical protein